METGYIKSNITKHISPKLFLSPWVETNGWNRHLANQIMW
jgi:hypothetical protein